MKNLRSFTNRKLSVSRLSGIIALSIIVLVAAVEIVSKVVEIEKR